ncbi:MAG: M28 family peptidase [Planctomycetota bacterium]
MKLTSVLACAGLAIASQFTLAQEGVIGPIDEVKKENLVETIQSLPPNRTGYGNEGQRRVLRQTENMLIERVKGMGIEPDVQNIFWNANVLIERTSPRPRVEFRNVIFEIPGTENPDRFMVIAAHFDTVPNTPGADDNATGVAALFEIARLVQADPRPIGVMFCLYNLEEIGIMGSRDHFREELKPMLDRGERELVGMLSLDMLGYYSDEEGSQTSPIPSIPGEYEPPTKGDFISLVTIARHAEFNKKLADAMQSASDTPGVFRFDFLEFVTPDVVRSDHAPFLLDGYDAVMVTDTANFRNPHYHQAGDTIETLDLDRLTGVTKQLVNAVWVLTQNE